MYSHLRRCALLGALLGLAASLPSLAAAQPAAYPSRPIQVIVPFAPGGNVDVTARLIAGELAKELGQPVVIENRPGAGGTLGSGQVAQSAPDGYTLLVGSTGPIATATALFKSLTYDPARDFTVLGGIQIVPMLLVGSPKLPARDFAELREYQARHGDLSVGSAGVGSQQHLTIELLNRQAKISLMHVPYKGTAPALNDVLGNQIDLLLDQMSTSINHVKEGRLKAIAQMGKTRSKQLPDVPTLSEQGVDGFEAVTFTALFGPAGLPPEVEHALQEALARVMAKPDVIERFVHMGAEPVTDSAAAFADFVRAEILKWQQAARTIGIQPE